MNNEAERFPGREEFNNFLWKVRKCVGWHTDMGMPVIDKVPIDKVARELIIEIDKLLTESEKIIPYPSPI